MRNRFFLWIKRVMNIFSRDKATKINKDVLVSSTMGEAIESWFDTFYNNPPWIGNGENKCKHQTKFAAILTNYMAVLASNEIMISAGKGKLADFIIDQIEKYVLPSMQQDIQLAGVGGALVLKPYVWKNQIHCEIIQANQFYPTRIVGGVVEACFFVEYATVGMKEYIRIEQHDLQDNKVVITNTAFLKDGSTPVSLDCVERWKDIDPVVIAKDVNRPLFAILKMPFPNTIDQFSVLPVSMYANSMETLREIDRIYSEFLWEVNTGKRRQIFDITAVNMQDKSKGQKPINIASDQYLILDMGDATKPYDDYTPEMRIEAYQKALDIQLRLLETQCGISPGTFTFEVKTGIAKTATEVISQDKITYNTIKSIQDKGLKEALEQLVEIYSIYAQAYKLAPSEKLDINVAFGDSVFVDTDVEYNRRMGMVSSGLLNGVEFVKWYFGVGDAEAKELMPDVSKDVD